MGCQVLGLNLVWLITAHSESYRSHHRFASSLILDPRVNHRYD